MKRPVLDHSHVRIVKASAEEPNAGLRKTLPTQNASAGQQPQVQLRELQPGVYEIEVICSCGERIAVRCESLAAPAAE